MSIKNYVSRSLIFLTAISCFKGGLRAQQVTIDSALYERVAELEKQASYKKPGEDHFMVVGLATFGFVSNKTTVTSGGISEISRTNSLADADHYEFSPMLLWRHGQKFLLEFEPSFDGNSLGVNWADISYFAAPGVIIRAGYLVIPFGTYNKRLAAGWIDKLPTDPAGVADIPPGSDFGIEVEGGLPLGNMKWNYDISLTNGLELLPDGELQSAGITDNNKNKTITGRLGLLPFSNSSLEVGVSGLLGTAGDDNNPSLSGVKTRMYAVDLNYVKLFNPVLVNIKGQYNYTHIDRATYVKATDSSNYTFDNNTSSYFAQVSLRPTGADSKLVKNLEAAFRIGNFITPRNSLWGQRSDLIEGGLLYWINWRTVLKFGYQYSKSDSRALDDPGTRAVSKSFFLQFSIQL
jgi:hypothetical protein